MLLAMDIGNTHIHLGLFEGPNLKSTWKVSNDRERTVDEFGMILRSLFRDGGVKREVLSAVAVASVVPTAHSMTEETVRRYLGQEPFFVGHDTSGDLLKTFRNPGEVGADRIANAVAGFDRYGGPLIVVDFGTGTTFDAIAADGSYLGGVIAPGISISIEALFRKAARLPRIDLKRPAKAVATDTVTSMQAGIIFGYAGLVDAIVQRVRAEIGEEARVVATGGLAALIARETGAVSVVDEHLTLDGIRLIYERLPGARTSSFPVDRVDR